MRSLGILAATFTATLMVIMAAGLWDRLNEEVEVAKAKSVQSESTSVEALVLEKLKGRELDIVPIGFWVAVKVAGERKSAAGIIMPAPKQSDQRWGTVVAVGHGDLIHETGKWVAPPLKRGDLVTLGPNRGEEVKVGTLNLVIINYRDILFALRAKDGSPLEVDF